MIDLCLKSLARSWKHNSGVQVATLLVLTGVFFVVTTFAMIHQNLNGLLTRWGQEVQMTVFLDDDISLDRLEQLRNQISENKHIESITYVSKDDAAKQFLSQMGSLAPDFLGDEKFGNPLPASLEVSLDSSLSKGSAVGKLVELATNLDSEAGVEDVAYGQGWIENYSSIVNQFGRSSWFIIIVLMAGSLLIVGNSIRNSVHQRREEIEVLELVGATPLRIQIPFIFEGVVFGFSAALLAVLATYLVFSGQSLIMDKNLQFLGLTTEVHFLSIGKVFMILAFGLACGAVGSWACVRRISSGWAAARRQEQWAR